MHIHYIVNLCSLYNERKTYFSTIFINLCEYCIFVIHFCKHKLMNMGEHFRSKEIFESIRQITDAETGELVVLKEPKRINFLVGKDHFYLVYSKFLSLIIEGELSSPEIKVYAYLLEMYGAGVPVTISKSIKTLMMKALNLKMGTINNAISSLTQKEHPLLFRKEKSLYYLNPRYAFKGSSSERDSQLKVVFELGCKNC